MNTFAKRSIVVFFWIVSVLGSFGFGAAISKRDGEAEIANYALLGLSQHLRLMSLLDKQTGDQTNESPRRVLAEQIVDVLLMIQAMNPEPQSLRGESLKALCFVASPGAKAIFDAATPGPVVAAVQLYLEDVRASVLQEVSLAQRSIVGGTECFLSPPEEYELAHTGSGDAAPLSP